MADMEFICPHCDNNLVVDDSGAGMQVTCPECGGALTIPSNINQDGNPTGDFNVEFDCPHCGRETSADGSKCGEDAFCIKCGKKLVVPTPNQDDMAEEPAHQITSHKTLRLRSDNDSHSQDKPRPCPYCNEFISSESVICVHCGTDLRTGRGLVTKGEVSGIPNFRQRSRHAKTYGGIGRLAFYGLTALSGLSSYLLFYVLIDIPVVSPIAHMITTAVLATIISAFRLRNIGKPTWLALLCILPIANVVVGYWCSVLPKGYEDTKQLDTASRIMIAVYVVLSLLILALLCSLGLSLRTQARATSQAKTCVSNLRIMDAAKEEAALKHLWNSDRAILPGSSEEAIVLGFVRKREALVCPSGGHYSWNPIGIDPACSMGGTHTLPPLTLDTSSDQDSALSSVDLENIVRESIEETFADKFPTAVVDSFTLTHVNGSYYDGKLGIAVDGETQVLSIDVTYDGEELSWTTKE